MLIKLHLTAKEKLLVWFVPFYLAINGFGHLFFPEWTNEMLSQPSIIRFIGGIVTLIAILQIRVKKEYIRSMGITLLLHGLWRLIFSSFATLELSYSNSIHGALFLTGAVICILIPYRIYRR